MTKISLTKIAIAVSTFACAGLLSVGWSEQRGVSLSVEEAQARVGRPLTPVSVAGVARRQNRRAAYGYGVGAGVAGAAAVATAGAVAGATSPGYYGGETPDGETPDGITLTPAKPIRTSASRITQSGPSPEPLPITAIADGRTTPGATSSDACQAR